MRTKFFSSFRWKMIKYFLISIILSMISVGALFLVASFFYNNRIEPFARLLRSFYYGSGPFLFFTMFVVGSVFVLLYYLLLTRGIIRYFEEISRSIDTIAGGQLEHRIPVRTDDELGDLAENINQMTFKLQQSMEEERAAQRTKYELITNVSHDLRTPLTSILGYLDLIEGDRYRDEVELRHYTQIVYAKAQRLGKLITDLFDYTKLQGGGIKLNSARINIGELVEQLVTESLPLMEQSGMECRILPPEEKVYVKADGDLIVRVFENLLTNAVCYGKEGKYVDIKWRKEEPEALIEFINYGSQIPTADIPHIFNRFYRVEKSRAGHSGGTGLGLAIAKNIVELNGGKISVYSDQHHTLFEVRLPVYLEEVKPL